MAMNTELLLKVKERILAEPSSFAMYCWGVTDSSANCGTFACLAGHTVAESLGPDALNGLSGSEIRHTARRLLGLDESAASKLFYDVEWPEPFTSDHSNAEAPSDKARAGAEYIDHFIATHTQAGEQS